MFSCPSSMKSNQIYILRILVTKFKSFLQIKSLSSICLVKSELNHVFKKKCCIFHFTTLGKNTAYMFLHDLKVFLQILHI